MSTRREELEEIFGVTPERMFGVLTTPNAVRSWWGASTCVIDPRKGGTFVTAAGDGDNASEFINSFQILEFDPPNRMLLGGGKYFAGTNWPIKTDMTTDFVIHAVPAGCTLSIIIDLTPADPLLDDYFEACVAGWQNCFEGIRNYLHNNPSE